jgi:hypothetical protein
MRVAPAAVDQNKEMILAVAKSKDKSARLKGGRYGTSLSPNVRVVGKR